MVKKFYSDRTRKSALQILNDVDTEGLLSVIQSLPENVIPAWGRTQLESALERDEADNVAMFNVQSPEIGSPERETSGIGVSMQGRVGGLGKAAYVSGHGPTAQIKGGDAIIGETYDPFASINPSGGGYEGHESKLTIQKAPKPQKRESAKPTDYDDDAWLISGDADVDTSIG